MRIQTRKVRPESQPSFGRICGNPRHKTGWFSQLFRNGLAEHVIPFAGTLAENQVQMEISDIYRYPQIQP